MTTKYGFTSKRDQNHQYVNGALLFVYTPYMIFLFSVKYMYKYTLVMLILCLLSHFLIILKCTMLRG